MTFHDDLESLRSSKSSLHLLERNGPRFARKYSRFAPRTHELTSFSTYKIREDANENLNKLVK